MSASPYELEKSEGKRVIRMLASAVACLLFALCALTSATSPAQAALFAQTPNVALPQVPGDGATDRGNSAAQTAPAVPSLPRGDVDFDIDLGTEEFENFGEEDFQVEEANYVRDTVVPIAIKVAIGAVIILLLAWVAMKVVKPKRPTSSE